MDLKCHSLGGLGFKTKPRADGTNTEEALLRINQW